MIIVERVASFSLLTALTLSRPTLTVRRELRYYSNRMRKEKYYSLASPSLFFRHRTKDLCVTNILQAPIEKM